MRIFLVAPRGAGQPELGTEEEYAAFVASHEVVPEIPLLAFVVSRDIDYEVSKAGNCEMLAILAHANESGVLLSDGSYLDVETIGQYARAVSAKYIYLNACNSNEFVNRLAIITACIIIYTAATITDTEAIRFGVLFAAALAETGSVETAFKQVAPRDRRYRIHKPKARMGNEELARQLTALSQQIASLTQQMLSVTQQASSLTHQLNQLASKVEVEVRVIQERHEGNRELIKAIQSQIQALGAHARAMQEFPPPPTGLSSNTVAAIGIATFVMGILFLVFWRGAG